MNREIKFRRWHKDLEGMIYSDNELGKFFTVTDTYPIHYYIMQYTGLKDKNGKEIYEGDIVRLDKGGPDWIKYDYEIIWFLGACCLSPIAYNFNKRSGSPLALITYADQCENNGLSRDIGRFIKVTGNIYENIELLKREAGFPIRELF